MANRKERRAAQFGHFVYTRIAHNDARREPLSLERDELRGEEEDNNHSGSSTRHYDCWLDCTTPYQRYAHQIDPKTYQRVELSE